jgi:hypothetical protein
MFRSTVRKLLLDWEIGHVQHGYTHEEASMYVLVAYRLAEVAHRRGW